MPATREVPKLAKPKRPIERPWVLWHWRPGHYLRNPHWGIVGRYKRKEDAEKVVAKYVREHTNRWRKRPDFREPVAWALMKDP